MKSIFKKIAFVLAIAMVVTMLPAKNVDAAASGPQLKKHRVLYLNEGGDVTGTYLNKAYATVWNFKEDGYTVKFESKNPEIATVGAKKGMVTAVSVGNTEVTATFSKKGAADVVKTCKVEVKKNAAVVTVDEDSQSKLGELKVGEKFTAVAVKTDADGSNEDITDGVRFAVADEKIATVNAKTGEITAVAAGETELTVWGVQWEYSMTEKKYVLTKTTTETPYKLVVKSTISAEQTAYNAFQIVFDTEDVAKAAVDETSKYLTSASAAVTEKEDIVKVYEVLKNAAKEKIGESTVTIGDISQKGDAKNIVNVRMFDELKQETDYIIRYKDKTVMFTTTRNVAAKLVVAGGKSTDLGGDSSRTDITLSIFAVGENSQDVNITGCADYSGWEAGVVLEEIGGEQYHPEYSVSNNPLDPYINFYTKDQKIAVTIKATFQDYFNKEKPGHPLENTTRITAGNHMLASGSIVAWGVHEEWVNRWTWDAFNHKEFAAEDLGKKLIVKAEVYYGGEKHEYANDWDTGFTFKSANEDKLVVDEYTGALFPAKEPKDEVVNVYVYFDGLYIGVCPVKVWAKRQLTGFTASVDSSQLSYNPSKGVDDEIKLTLKPVDQLGDAFKTDMSVTCEVYGNDTMKGYVNLGGTGNGKLTIVTDTENDAYVIKIKGTSSLPQNQTRSIRVLCTATYNNGLTKRTLTASAAFTAKNTAGANVTNYRLSMPTELDMLLKDEWGKRYGDKATTITAHSIDREGFKVEKLAIEPRYSGVIGKEDSGKYLVTIQQGNEYVQKDRFVQGEDSQELTLNTVIKEAVYVVSGSAVSGSAINAAPIVRGRTATPVANGTAYAQPTLLKKMDAGSYQVSLYVPNSNGVPTYRTGTVIQIKDSQPTIGWKWANHSVDARVGTYKDVLDAIRGAFTFNKLDDGANTQKIITDSIYIGEVVLKDGTPVVNEVKDNNVVVGYLNEIDLSDDVIVQGSSVAVKQVRYIVTYKEVIDKVTYTYYYETLIPINKSIWVGVTQ